MPSPFLLGAPARLRPCIGPTLALTLALSAPIAELRAQSVQPAPHTSRDTAVLSADGATFAASVDNLFAPWRGSDRPGCVVGVSHRGRPLLERAYGMADLESATPMTPATVVHSASIAKQVTALAVLLLERDG